MNSLKFIIFESERIKKKLSYRIICKQGSASGIGSLGSRSTGPGNFDPIKILNPGPAVQKGQPGLAGSRKNPGLGPGRKIRESRIRDRDSKLKNPGSGTWTGTQICGTRDSRIQLWGIVLGTKEFRDSVSWTENFLGHGPGPVQTPVCNSSKIYRLGCRNVLLRKFSSFHTICVIYSS